MRLFGYLELSAPIGEGLRDDMWAPLSIRHHELRGLTVQMGDTVLLDGLALPGFHPRPGWTIGVAASSADDAQSTDEHWIADLRISSGASPSALHSPPLLPFHTPPLSTAARPPPPQLSEAHAHAPCRAPAGALLDRASVPVRVSLNGQQFHPPAPLHYTLRTLPMLETALPLLGSTDGGTLLQISGLHLGTYPAATRHCRFGDPSRADEVLLSGAVHVEASMHHTDAAGRSTVHCLAPAASAAGAVHVRVSLNGLQFSLGAVTFTYHAPLELMSLAPAFGSSEGATLVEVRGTLPAVGRSLGVRPLCRFRTPDGDEVPTFGTFAGGGSDRLLCRTPRADLLHISSLPLSADVRISINDADFASADIANPVAFEYVPEDLEPSTAFHALFR